MTGSHQLPLLVVDDEEDLLWACKMGLHYNKFKVVAIREGEEALRYVENREYPIVLLDAKLPGKDGFQIAESIKQRHPNTYIIMISGYYNYGDQEVQHGLQSGLLYDFIGKPFDLEEVLQIIESIMPKL